MHLENSLNPFLFFGMIKSQNDENEKKNELIIDWNELILICDWIGDVTFLLLERWKNLNFTRFQWFEIQMKKKNVGKAKFWK